MKYKSEYGEINLREIGTGRAVSEDKGQDWLYDHTIQVGFKGKYAQFQFGSAGNKLSTEELLEAFRYFMFTGLYAEKGYEAFCGSKWGVEPEVANTPEGRKEYFEDFQRCDKRRQQLERIGITPDMAYSIEQTLGFDILWNKTEKWT